MIAGNDGDGVRIVGADGTSNVVEGNNIGVGADGVTELGNLGAGVSINSSRNTIAHNVIADNGSTATGIAVDGGTRNRITENEIRDNLGLGINLGNDGVTLERLRAAGRLRHRAERPAELPRPPDRARADGVQTTISGTMTSEPNELHTIEVFTSPNVRPEGHGEGTTFLGSTTMTTNPTGGGPWSVTVPGTVPGGHFVTADGDGLARQHVRVHALPGDAGAEHVSSSTMTTDSGSGGCTEVDCSLREAIEDSNGLPGRQTIVFGILPPGPKTLTLNSPMLPITDEVTIDGTTQPGGRPVISGAGALLDRTTASSSSGRARTGRSSAASLVNGSESYGLVVASTGNTIEDIVHRDESPSARSSVANLNGMLVSGNNNTVGGVTGAARQRHLGQRRGRTADHRREQHRPWELHRARRRRVRGAREHAPRRRGPQRRQQQDRGRRPLGQRA